MAGSDASCAIDALLANNDPIPLWRVFSLSREERVRQRLITFYLRFARIMAAKIYASRTHSAIEFADYLQCARLGLMEAVDRFDFDRGIKFETFAASRIKGAILNGVASLSEIQQQINARKRILAERVEILREEGGAPEGPEALFAHLAELAIGLAVGFALDDSGMYQAEEAACRDNIYAGVELRQLCGRIRELLEELPGKQKKVISYHYLQQIAFEEIASMLALSKGRIAQIHKEALGNLRERLRRPDMASWRF